MPRPKTIENIVEYRKQYYLDHKEKFSHPQFCETCECFVKTRMNRHKDTQKHLKHLNSQ